MNIIMVLTPWLLLIYFLNPIASLECYQCNSHIDADCYKINTETQKPKLCPSELQGGCQVTNQEAPFRFDSNSSTTPSVRTYRACTGATKEQFPTGCIDRVGTDKVKMRYCVCRDDACNQSGCLMPSSTIIFMFILSSIVLLHKVDHS